MTSLAIPAADSDASTGARARAGILYSVGAYTIWGLLPLYLRLVKSVSPIEFLMHRVLWSALFVAGVLGFRRHWAWLPPAIRSGTVVRRFIASSAVLSVNWFLYVWAVASGHIVDASLGYFINPLFSIALGAVLLNERLSRVRWAAVGLAAMGVLWLAIQLKQVPWIGLGLAASFGTYGFLRKTATLGALEGLALETLLLFPFAFGALVWLGAHGESRFVIAGPGLKGVIILAGPITAVPLLLFAAGARRIPLSLVGLLQYIGPTLQLLIGVVVAGEGFSATKMFGYALIWVACAIAAADQRLNGGSR